MAERGSSSSSPDGRSGCAGRQRPPGPAALVAPAVPGQVPGGHQHLGRRRSDGGGGQSAADPGDAQGGGEAPRLEEDR